jgi:hypothetical protein
MVKTTHNSITTIEQAIQILAYNEHFWEDFKVHPMDRKTVNSLADAPYAWTEKQGRLALALLKRYHTLFQKYNIDLSTLLQNPVYKETFRVIDYVKSVEQYQHEDGRELIEIKFPYNEKLISLLRTLKNKKADRMVPAIYDGESKKWTLSYTELTCYYITLIAIRYDFKIVTPHILEDFEEIKKEKLSYRPLVIKLNDDQIVIDHANENLIDWWNNNYKNQTMLRQFDVLKNLSIPSVIPSLITEQSTLAEKIATSMNTNLWIDRNKYSKKDFLQALQELDLFPAVVPLSGMIEKFDEVKEFESWYRAFEDIGFSHSQIVWGLTLEEAPTINKEQSDKELWYAGNTDYIYGQETSQSDREEMQDRWNNLVLESKASKYIDENTKLVIIRNRIPRTLIKSRIKLRCGFVLQDTTYWPTNTETVARMVDNLPKRLYYVSRKPGFLETNIVQI